MAVVWPSKNNFANGDVLTAANMNNIADTLNVFNPTSATNGQIWTANGSGSGSYQTLAPASITQLATASLTSGGSYSFTSINQGYTNLILYLNNLDVTSACSIQVNINGDAVLANRWMSYTDIGGAYSTAASYSTTAGVMLTVPTANFSATTYTNNFVVNIPFYSTATHRQATAVGTYVATSRTGIFSEYTGNYSDNGGSAAGADSAAVTSLKILLSAGTLTAGTATLYGVK